MGSPPLVRERQFSSNFPIKCNGITPARAGKTRRIVHPSTHIQDHPRSCGKDDIYTSTYTVYWGSPPLVRERRYLHKHLYCLLGITPARAGKTPYHRTRTHAIEDHPRSCGKDPVSAILAGLSAGITPARAGKTHYCKFVQY